jgi:hypothetical protein
MSDVEKVKHKIFGDRWNMILLLLPLSSLQNEKLRVDLKHISQITSGEPG